MSYAKALIGNSARLFACVPLWGVFWIILVSVPLYTRTYLPIDETRYVSVAWDMWRSHDFLVPHLNGRVYSDKPPLLFWLFNMGWAIFGVNDLWPRLVSPILGAASLVLMARIARRLWPDIPLTSRLAPLMTVSSMLWMIFVSAAMFDMLIVFLTLLAVSGMVRCWQDSDWKGWLIFGVAVGLGILAKGPVILLHTLPVALLAPWWALESRPERWISWYGGVVSAVLLGGIIGLSWAVPAAIAGGEEYSHAIFWGQSAGRMVRSFAHERPVWWYVPLLPLILFPWALWPPVWRALGSLVAMPRTSAVRICLAWIVPVFAAFSCISGKQPHYLLPLFPAFALLTSYALSGHASYRSWDQVLPGLFITISGILLVMHSVLPIQPGVARLLSGLSPVTGMALMALGVMLFTYHLCGKMRRVILISTSSIVFVTMLNTGLAGVLSAYDMRGMSSYLAHLQREDIALAYVGKYHGTFNFLGRLHQPVEVIAQDQALGWAASHPHGRIIADEDHLEPGDGVRPEMEYPYGLHTLKVWKSSCILGMMH